MRFIGIVGLGVTVLLLGCASGGSSRQGSGTPTPQGEARAADGGSPSTNQPANASGAQPAPAQSSNQPSPQATPSPAPARPKSTRSGSGSAPAGQPARATGSKTPPAQPATASSSQTSGKQTGAASAAGAAKSESPAAASTGTPQTAAPSSAGSTKAASLDLNGLEDRLRSTRAIGVFTKLSLKNQVDDLLGEFRAFHARKQPPLSQLRQQYDLLLIKVLSLLQDGDPPLAAEISSSREALWNILTDPQKFARL